MKSARFQKYLKAKAEKKANPAPVKKESNKTQDKKTNQDFSGYPHGTAAEEIIKPKTKTQKKTAAVEVKDGEKVTETATKKKSKKKDEDTGE